MSNSLPAKAGASLLAAIAVAMTLVLPLTSDSEGERLRPYRDPAGVLTVCDGETQHIENRLYTHAECQAMLRTRMARDYAPAVARCVPAITASEHRLAFAAAIDAAYNAGPGAFCGSSMAAAFKAGRWSDGCAAFLGWRVTAGGKRLLGLVRRRERERRLCLTGRID